MHQLAMRQAAKSGVVVFLDTDSHDIADRLHRMKVDRIVGQAPGVSMLDLLAYRQPFYEGAHDIRIVCERFQNPDDVSEKVLKALRDYQKPPGYISTRSDPQTKDPAPPHQLPNFPDVVLQGLASDSGLYIPNSEPPHFSQGEWARLLGCTYQQRALRILEKWIHARDFHPSNLATAIQRAYSLENFQNESVVPVTHLQDNQYIMEVFHGPTASFKDAALQLMPQFFTEAVQREGEKVRYLILVATSGDTGSAVLDGFSKFAGESGTLVMVLYPENGISEVQKLLMTAATGDNVHVIGVDSDFDFCQTAIKGIFADGALAADLLANHGVRLSAANSINWGRLVPQVVYHASAYLDLVQQGVVSMGDECDICIPTGNFGNILGAIYAKTMGIPFRKFICASNENDVLMEFIQTGCYDLRHRHLHVTMAPAIDILKSSNLERFLFLASGGDGAEVRRCYEQLAREKYFQISPKVLDSIQNEFGLTGDCCEEKEYAASIKKTLTQTGYLMDPHTAVAKVVADRRRPRDVPLLLCSTAHYGKFPVDVAKSLGRRLVSSTDNPRESLRDLETVASRPGVHRELRAVLERPRLHHRTLRASRDEIVEEMVDFVSSVTR
ncbi:threonine synthase-like 1 isoform X3 [Acanthaster planci]|nr:threonine synthase-like 1 isoform X3 [Acanthaster planci]